MSFPSDREKHLLTKFRSRVFDILKPGEDRSDQFLLRWIRVQDGNLEKAELMIRKSFDWRREFGVDEILLNKTVDPHILNLCPYTILGTDTLGHPVLSIALGQWNLSRVVSEGIEGDFSTFCIQLFERLMEHVRESNRGRKPWEFQNTQFTVIADWAGYSYQQLVNFKAVQLILKLGSLYEVNYPDTMYKSFFINCPSIFSRLFAMLKPVLRDKTVSKIKVYGTNRQEWEGKIKRLMQPNQVLLPEYGEGGNSNNDNNCVVPQGHQNC